jgi:hypothetical protein
VSGDLEIDIAIDVLEALVAADLGARRAEQPSEQVHAMGRLHQ